MVIAIFVFLGFAIAFPFLVGIILSAPRYKGPVTDHFDGKQFINPKGMKAQGFPAVFKWMRERKQGKWVERKSIPPGDKPLPRYDDGIRITFVNHSTFLIQTDGLNILTDPVWSERTSPFEFAGPKRMRPPGIRFEDLPKIDLVLLSHNHYDHLDIKYVEKLHKVYNPTFVVPLGVSAFLKRHNITLIKELDWWQTESFGSFQIEAVPAQHFSGRGILDRDATLWCGYVINRSHGNIYFAGDTGYNDETFKVIGERCKPKFSIIPIGAFKPEWFMSPIHCSPHEAVKIHLDLKSEQSVASHFGTFPLADDGLEDPVIDLTAALKSAGVDAAKFVALTEGVAVDY